MNIVPISKSDLDACEKLNQATDGEIKENINELLEWVQDINWPVAPHICERLKSIGAPLVEPIRMILTGNDEVWKYMIISNLLSKTDSETVSLLKTELENIAINPTDGEKTEEVNLVASEVLRKCH